MSYSYKVVGQRYLPEEISEVRYMYEDEAFDAAKSKLTTMYMTGDCTIYIYDLDGENPETPIDSFLVSPEDIRQSALGRIERANRPELKDTISEALEEHKVHEDQYSKGLITPEEFARLEEITWIHARINIGAAGGS